MSDGDRREFLTHLGVAAVGCTAAAGIVGLQPMELLAVQAPQPPSGGTAAARYANLMTDRFFAASEVQGETDVAFLEGPAVDRAANVFFTNYTLDQILKWEPATKKLSVFRSPCGHANGLLFDRQGRLVACETDGRVTRTDMRTGEITVLCDQYRGYPLGAPNDVCADERGRLYFTSRLPNRDLAQGNVNAVYRIDPDGRVEQVLAWPQIDMPNGIITSPDDKLLYLVDSDGTEKGARRIRRYALRDDVMVADERTLYDFFPGRSGDGMEIDAEGNLYVAAGLHRRRGTSETLDTRPGIHVISPEGKLLAFVETTEDTITNCAFGGADLRTMYITCGKRLFSLPTKIPGKASYRPEA
jgi:gluconolactonase